MDALYATDVSVLYEILAARVVKKLGMKEAHDNRYLVADAALYASDTLRDLHRQGQRFITRVPLMLSEAKAHVQGLHTQALTALDNGYSGRCVSSTYAGVPQRWLLLKSEQATHREQHTVEKHLTKYSMAELKRFQKFCKKRFACEQDAKQALEEFMSSLTLLRLESMTCEACLVYGGRGRPSADQMPSHIEYQWQGHAVSCLTQTEERHLRSGVFILATNDNDIDMQRTLDLYKSQQRVERGFRFLKSPEFLTSALFLKKPERIEALLMVMTCSLMIYAALKHRIRQGLKANNVSIPDMKRKPTQSPTARWVFLCFSGLHELRVGDAPPIIVNLQERQQTILAVLGERYRQIYS